MGHAYKPGQRWQSATEPELGLGVVQGVSARELVVAFPARDLTRRYATEHAPLVRARLTEGQTAHGEGRAFVIESVAEHDGVLTYQGEGQELVETYLDAELDVGTPENRLRGGQVDAPEDFDLRREALAVRHHVLASPARGFLGGRIRLLDHQLSIARDVCERHRVRVLLADEVGLGKTIEALLVLHRMLLSGRVERALVLVPPALVHQWLAEAYLRFNLILRVVGRDTAGSGAVDPDTEDLPAELEQGQLFVCPMGTDDGEVLHDTPWDLLIVDEAHHLFPGNDDFALVEALAQRVPHVVMLSATPARDGEAAHFRRLALLDPARFADYDAYRAEAEHYRALADTSERLHRGAPLEDQDRARLRERLTLPDLDALLAAADAGDAGARRRLLVGLLDLHGIGRAMFRNVRARIAGFPRRVPHHADLQADDAARARLHREFLHDLGRDPKFKFAAAGRDPRTAWLRALLEQHPHDKVLVLGSTRDKVESFAKALATPQREVARFHERMSSIERDRQAAWFLSDDGPQVLISSALGAEGRNFQAARHLVLLDLPLEADRVEQLIGRLDRIGQGSEVHIHTAAVPGTPQARLRRWHQHAVAVFEKPWHGDPTLEHELGEALVEALLAEDGAAAEALVVRGAQRNGEIALELEAGRDRLLELLSFDADAAHALNAAIEAAEEGPQLERFMAHAFERGGLDVDFLGRRSYQVRAGDDYLRPFPGFCGDEMLVTFDREVGLARPDRVLLTHDHPMVRDTLDTLLGSDAGNASLAALESDRPGLVLEAVFVAEPTAKRALRADRFFPPTPIHVAVDITGEETELPEDARLRAGDPALVEHDAVQARIPDLLQAARELAEQRAPEVAAAAQARMREELEPALARLGELAAAQDAAVAEQQHAEAERAALEQGLASARVRLDAVRLVVLAAE